MLEGGLHDGKNTYLIFLYERYIPKMMTTAKTRTTTTAIKKVVKTTRGDI